eukprot:13031729-Heterocapsa_arctica.AAC.1
MASLDQKPLCRTRLHRPAARISSGSWENWLVSFGTSARRGRGLGFMPKLPRVLGGPQRRRPEAAEKSVDLPSLIAMSQASSE